MTDLSPAVAGDCNRLDFTASLLEELVRLLDAVARGPAGRHLRHCRGADGRPLFVWATAGREEVLVAPHLIELLEALRSARPAATCPDCRGEQCPACRHAGYLPADPSLLSADPVPPEPPAIDVSEVFATDSSRRR